MTEKELKLKKKNDTKSLKGKVKVTKLRSGGYSFALPQFGWMDYDNRAMLVDFMRRHKKEFYYIEEPPEEIDPIFSIRK